MSNNYTDNHIEQAQICADLVAKVADICFLELKEWVHLVQYF